MVPEDYVDCPELCDKTIEKVRIYKVNSEGIDMQIDLTDGTVFSCSFCAKPVFEARLMTSEGSLTEVLQSYELE